MYRIIGADGREYGPVTRETLAQWIGEGRAAAHTQARAEISATWQPLSALPEFAPCFHAGAGVSTPPPQIQPPIAGAAPIAPLPVRRTNALATTSFVMGLLSWGLCCCTCIPFNVLGVVFGIIALAQIGRAPLQEEGRSLAIAGLVLSLLNLLMSIPVFLFGLAGSMPGIGHGIRHW